jgi:hypothetical protein
MEKDKDKGQKVFEIFIWCLVAASLSIVVTSLILSAFIRYKGLATLDDVAHVGDFWGGHLNSLALVALALGLFLQKKQLDNYQRELAKTEKSLDEQLKAIQQDTVQQSAHFLLVQLQEKSQTLECRATRYTLDGQQEHSISYKGIRYLSDLLDLRKEMPDLIVVAVRLKDLTEYVTIADAILQEIERMTQGSQEVVKIICKLLCPDVVRKYCNEISDTLQSNIREWNSLDDLTDEGKKKLKYLAERDYIIETQNVGGKYSAFAFSEMEQMRYTSGDNWCTTPEAALQAMCDRIR